MTSKLKAKAEKRVREIADATVWSGDMRVNMTTVVGALRCAVKMLDEERAARLADDDTDRALLRAAITLLEEIVCVIGDDRGVVLMSNDSPTHYDAAVRCQVYDHENFSPLGDALIRLHDKLREVAK